MSAPTRGPVSTIYGTVGATPTVIMTFLSGNTMNIIQNFFQIQNVHATQSLAYTFDGVTPVINGAGNTLSPLMSETEDVYAINGPTALTIVGSGAGTSFTIKYA